MSETSLWAWLRPYLPEGQYSRIESPDTSPGYPDVAYRTARASGSLELKFAQHPKALVPFKDEDDGLHRTQKSWIRENVRLGGIVWIVAQIGKDVLFIPGRYSHVFNGSPARYLYAIAELILTQGAVTRKQLKQLKRMLENNHG